MSEILMLAAALWYAERGIAVFPLHYPTESGGCSCGEQDCNSPGKHPRTRNGFKDATTDEACIREWWRRWPQANIGIPTGAVTHFLIVDCDPRNGGPTTQAELSQQVGPIPETTAVNTGGGGRHFYLWYAGGPVPKSLAKGIDLKGDGGYVVAPPSLHVSGQRYAWDGMSDWPVSIYVADGPDWLLELIAKPRAKARAEIPIDGQKWGKGERNNKLVSVAGTMRRRGFSREAIEAALLEENCRRCEPPLSETEVRRIAESVASYKPAEEAAQADCDDDATAAQPNWPDELKPEALYGLAGELVRVIEPHSEADPAALLIQLLVAFGNVIGRNAHFMAEADKHFTNLSAVIVGQTAKGRKGTSLGQIRRPLEAIDAAWSKDRIMGGLASGEGLIWAVRDEIRVSSAIRKKGRVAEYEEVIADKGESDKRLLVVEPEFARVLQVAEREHNTLSAIIRQAWDTGNLRIMTKKQAARSTEAHISIIGHITKDELKRLLTDTAAGNGFANRILWVCARRSKLLPEGGFLHTVDFTSIVPRLQAAANFARGVDQMRRDDKARAIWGGVYENLSEGKPGLLGAVISRAEAQVMRLACVYALLDCSAVIRAEHLMAALAAWQYCEDSARFIFGDALGDATADEILRELRHHPQGMSRNDIREHFNRNKSAAELGRALGVLQEYGLARMERSREQEGQNRPTERWFALTTGRG